MARPPFLQVREEKRERDLRFVQNEMVNIAELFRHRGEQRPAGDHFDAERLASENDLSADTRWMDMALKKT